MRRCIQGIDRFAQTRIQRTSYLKLTDSDFNPRHRLNLTDSPHFSKFCPVVRPFLLRGGVIGQACATIQAVGWSGNSPDTYDLASTTRFAQALLLRLSAGGGIVGKGKEATFCPDELADRVVTPTPTALRPAHAQNLQFHPRHPAGSKDSTAS